MDHIGNRMTKENSCAECRCSVMPSWSEYRQIMTPTSTSFAQPSINKYEKNTLVLWEKCHHKAAKRQWAAPKNHSEKSYKERLSKFLRLGPSCLHFNNFPSTIRGTRPQQTAVWQNKPRPIAKRLAAPKAAVMPTPSTVGRSLENHRPRDGCLGKQENRKLTTPRKCSAAYQLNQFIRTPIHCSGHTSPLQ